MSDDLLSVALFAQILLLAWASNRASGRPHAALAGVPSTSEPPAESSPKAHHVVTDYVVVTLKQGVALNQEIWQHEAIAKERGLAPVIEIFASSSLISRQLSRWWKSEDQLMRQTLGGIYLLRVNLAVFGPRAVLALTPYALHGVPLFVGWNKVGQVLEASALPKAQPAEMALPLSAFFEDVVEGRAHDLHPAPPVPVIELARIQAEAAEVASEQSRSFAPSKPSKPSSIPPSKPMSTGSVPPPKPSSIPPPKPMSTGSVPPPKPAASESIRAAAPTDPAPALGHVATDSVADRVTLIEGTPSDATALRPLYDSDGSTQPDATTTAAPPWQHNDAGVSVESDAPLIARPRHPAVKRLADELLPFLLNAQQLAIEYLEASELRSDCSLHSLRQLDAHLDDEPEVAQSADFARQHLASLGVYFGNVICRNGNAAWFVDAESESPVSALALRVERAGTVEIVRPTEVVLQRLTDSEIGLFGQALSRCGRAFI